MICCSMKINDFFHGKRIETSLFSVIVRDIFSIASSIISHFYIFSPSAIPLFHLFITLSPPAIVHRLNINAPLYYSPTRGSIYVKNKKS